MSLYDRQTLGQFFEPLYKGLSKPAINAIRAVALLMEELEKDNLKETIHNLVTCQLNELGKDIKTFITEATSQINKAVANNVNTIACLVDEDYTKQLATDITTDIPQTKVDYLMIPSTSHDNNISIQLDSHLAPITAKLTTIAQIMEQSASKLAEIAISTKLLVNKPPVPAPPLPMPTATSNLTPPSQHPMPMPYNRRCPIVGPPSPLPLLRLTLHMQT